MSRLKSEKYSYNRKNSHEFSRKTPSEKQKAGERTPYFQKQEKRKTKKTGEKTEKTGGKTPCFYRARSIFSSFFSLIKKTAQPYRFFVSVEDSAFVLPGKDSVRNRQLLQNPQPARRTYKRIGTLYNSESAGGDR